MLDDPIVLARGLDALAALEDVVAARFFHIDVFSRLAGPNRHERMPMVWRGDADGVDLVVLKHLPHIGVLFDLDVLLGQIFRHAVEDALVHIAKVHIRLTRAVFL